MQFKKPKVCVFDLFRCVIKPEFNYKFISNFISENCSQFLTVHGQKSRVKVDIELLRKQAIADGMSIADENEDFSRIVETTSEYIRGSLKESSSSSNRSSAMKRILIHIVVASLKKKKLIVPVDAEGAAQIKVWSKEYKIVIFSHAWGAVAKYLLQYTDQGDLSGVVSKYLDTTQGIHEDVKTYKTACDQLNVKPKEALFITKYCPAARAAEKAGLQVVLYLTKNDEIKSIKREYRHIPVITTFNEIDFSNEMSVSISRSRSSIFPEMSPPPCSDRKFKSKTKSISSLESLTSLVSTDEKSRSNKSDKCKYKTPQ